MTSSIPFGEKKLACSSGHHHAPEIVDVVRETATQVVVRWQGKEEKFSRKHGLKVGARGYHPSVSTVSPADIESIANERACSDLRAAAHECEELARKIAHADRRVHRLTVVAKAAEDVRRCVEVLRRIVESRNPGSVT